MAAPVDDRDRHVRRSGDDYTSAMMSLLPSGAAWPKSVGGTLYKTVNGLTQYWGFVDRRAADLLEVESDPRFTYELLTDWERAWGLPDPCLTSGQSFGERRAFLLYWMTLLGAQSEQFYVDLAKMIGIDIGISEHAPFMCGISRCGTTLDVDGKARWEIGPQELRFYWQVSLLSPRLTWFRCSSGQCGVDPHLDIGREEDLECILERWKPAHTDIVFDYSGVTMDNPYAGTGGDLELKQYKIISVGVGRAVAIGEAITTIAGTASGTGTALASGQALRAHAAGVGGATATGRQVYQAVGTVRGACGAVAIGQALLG